MSEELIFTIPALKPGTVGYEVAENTSTLDAAYNRFVEPALRADTDASRGWRAFARVREKVEHDDNAVLRASRCGRWSPAAPGSVGAEGRATRLVNLKRIDREPFQTDLRRKNPK